MQKKIKCLISIFLSLIVIASLATTVCAVEPRYSDTNSITVTLGFDGTTAACAVKIYGVDGTISIDNVNITLKDSNGNVKGIWTNLSSSGDYFSFSKTVPNLDIGKTYTLSVSANVNGNNNTELVKDSCTGTCQNPNK